MTNDLTPMSNNNRLLLLSHWDLVIGAFHARARRAVVVKTTATKRHYNFAEFPWLPDGWQDTIEVSEGD
jgi:hypothetical protein